MNKFLFWLFLHTPEHLKRFYPQSVIDRIAEATKKEIDSMQSDIIKSKWKLIEAEKHLQHIKRND